MKFTMELLKFYIILNIFLSSNLSFAKPGQFGFQFPATTIAYGIINLHHQIMFLLIWIVVLVFYLIYFIVKKYYIYKFSEYSSTDVMDYIRLKKQYNVTLRHHALSEILWITLPTLVLLLIVFPSFALLYSFEVCDTSFLSIKIIGHQWYWSYEYAICGAPNVNKFSIGYLINEENYKNYSKNKHSFFSPLYDKGAPLLANSAYSFSIDSHMIYESELKKGNLRLLSTTEPLVLPIDVYIPMYITSDDVLHSWTIPSFGCKMDACPGRINQFSLFIKKTGIYYGQCSELCGVNHGFMPIEVIAVEEQDFKRFIYSHVRKLEDSNKYSKTFTFMLNSTSPNYKGKRNKYLEGFWFQTHLYFVKAINNFDSEILGIKGPHQNISEWRDMTLRYFNFTVHDFNGPIVARDYKSDSIYTDPYLTDKIEREKIFFEEKKKKNIKQ